MIIARAERDGFRKQLTDFKSSNSQESGRKTKALEKAKAESAYLVRVQSFLRQLILNEYRYLKAGKNAVKVNFEIQFKF